jgi:hypothetical protein
MTRNPYQQMVQGVMVETSNRSWCLDHKAGSRVKHGMTELVVSKRTCRETIPAISAGKDDRPPATIRRAVAGHCAAI